MHKDVMLRRGWRLGLGCYSPPVEECPVGVGWLGLAFGFRGVVLVKFFRTPR